MVVVGDHQNFKIKTVGKIKKEKEIKKMRKKEKNNENILVGQRFHNLLL